jgi:hypothetical protein
MRLHRTSTGRYVVVRDDPRGGFDVVESYNESDLAALRALLDQAR